MLACTPAWARGDLGADAGQAQLRDSHAPASPQIILADRIDALLTARFAAVAAMTPAADAAGLSRHRRALEDLGAFAAATVDGLLAAAPDGETRMLMDLRLRPILTRHREAIAAALAELERDAACLARPSGLVALRAIR